MTTPSTQRTGERTELALKKGESEVLHQGDPEQVVQPCDPGGQQPNAWGLKRVDFHDHPEA